MCQNGVAVRREEEDERTFESGRQGERMGGEALRGCCVSSAQCPSRGVWCGFRSGASGRAAGPNSSALLSGVRFT